MNEVCDTWNSPWSALQKALAGVPAHTPRMPGGNLDASTWLGRARDLSEGKPLRRPMAVPAR
jgi:hypothetical protein